MASRISTNQRDQSKGSPTSKPSESSNRSTNQSIQRNNTQPSQSSYQRQSDHSIHSPYYITSDQLTLSPGFQSQSFNQPSNRYPSSSSNALTSLDINQALPHSVPVSGSVSSSCRLHLDANDPMTDRQNIQHPLQTNQQPTNQSNNQRIPQQQHEPLPELDWHGDIDTTDESDYEDEDLEQEDDDDYGSEDDSPRSGRVLTFADEHGDNLCHVLTYDPQAYHQNPATTDTSQISSKSSINLDSVEDANLQAQLHAQKIAREREKRTLRNDAEAACQCSIQ